MAYSLLFPLSLTDLASISQVLQITVVIYGVVYGKKQLDELVKTRNLESIREIIKELGTQEIRDIRTWLMTEYNESSNDNNLVSAETDAIEKVRKLAVAYDRIGFLVLQGIAPERPLYDFQKDEIRILWHKCKPFVSYMRSTCRRENYCKHFEYLGEAWLDKMDRKMDRKNIPLLNRLLKRSNA